MTQAKKPTGGKKPGQINEGYKPTGGFQPVADKGGSGKPPSEGSGGKKSAK